MREALQTISKSNQVVFSTHSPFLVTAECLSCVTRICKTSDEESGLDKTLAMGPLVADASETDRDMLTVLNFHRSSRIFFAETLVLVEGEGDVHLHRAAFEKLVGKTLEQTDLALVEIGGKDRLGRIKDLLRKICPKVVAIADLDYIWNGAGNELGPDPTLSQLGDELKELEDKAEFAESLSEEAKHKEIKKMKKRACCEGSLAEKRDAVCGRLEDCGTFVLRSGEIEDYVGLSTSSKGKYLDAARQIADGDRAVEHAEELRDLYSRVLKFQPSETA